MVAILGALLLPLAPVTAERPVVTWPQSATAPQSTALLLTNGTPESLDLRFSCAGAARAQAGGGVLFSTMRPEEPSLPKLGLVVRVAGSVISLATGGRTYALGRSDDGPCDVAVLVDARGLTVTRNGQDVVRQNVRLPSVDGLITNVGPTSSATSADLSVRLSVVDVFASSPTALKLVLIVVIGLAVMAVLFLLYREDRSGKPPSRPRLRLTVPDVAVVVTLLVWLAIAPTTDDDGYYSAMARNSGEQGFVGNYFQMFNQSFTPFTWPWQALAVWQRVGGDSVVWLRTPALMAGLVTWWALRRFTEGRAPTLSARSRRWFPYLLGLTFLAWWLPYCMGVRPETVVAMCAMLTLLLVAEGLESGRLSRVALAAAVAGLGFAAHPTGFVALAPLIVTLPALWCSARLARGPRGAAVRGLAILAAATVASLAAFADGTLHDFLAGEARFRAIEQPLDWTNEILRYEFLLSNIPMGSYAKRVPILLAIVLLVWFLVLHLVGRTGGSPLRPRTSLTGWCLIASFLLLWMTPSKWTHHFGSLSGVGPPFIALLIATGIPALRVIAQRHGIPKYLPWVVAASLVPAIALALQGPNYWAYWWNLGMPPPGFAPLLHNVSLGSPAFAIVSFGAAALLLWPLMRRFPGLRPIWGLLVSSVVIVAVLGGTVLYLVWTFGLSTVNTLDTYSPGAANVADPLGCSASQAVTVMDDRTARPLSASGAAPPAESGAPGFIVNGYWPGSPPPGGTGDGPQRQAWGSFTDKEEATVGRFTTGWYALPQSWSGGDRVVTFLSGRAAGASTLVAEFGRTSSAGVATVLQRPVVDLENLTSWRAAVLVGPQDLPDGADVVRLVAYDGETTNGGWMAFTAPELEKPVPLESYVPAGSPATVSWQIALLFPCIDQIKVRHGITEPPQYAVTWPFSALLNDGTWQLNRGGLTATAVRLGSLVSPASYLTNDPGVNWGRVYRFRYPYTSSSYDVKVQHEVIPGWRGIVPDRVSMDAQ